MVIWALALSSIQGRIPLFINDVLKPFHRKFYSNLVRERPNLVLMQDNAPCDTSARTRKWISQKNIKLLTWPPQSPDTNLIESIWDIFQKRINARSREFKIPERSSIPRMGRTTCETLCKLVESYPNYFKLSS